MPWNRLELLLVGLAVTMTILLIGHRSYQHLYLERATDQISANIHDIAKGIQTYHRKTGRWFPKDVNGSGSIRVFPDPFHPNSPDYQGLEASSFDRASNYGVVLQLVRFDPTKDTVVPVHLFEAPFARDEPYLRLLLDYGERSQVETEILIRVQARLPLHAIGEVDDHYYVVDIRRLFDDQP